MEALMEFGLLRPNEPLEGALVGEGPEASNVGMAGTRSQLGWNANVGMTMQLANVDGSWNRAGIAPGLISAGKLVMVMCWSPSST